MLSVVCWKWTQPGCRSSFGPEHVNTLQNMVARNYRGEHRFICITDDRRGLHAGVEVFPIGNLFADLRNPLGPEYPSCYRRLVAFRDDFRDVVGGRFVSVDLDVVIVGDVTPLWDRKEEVVFWQSPIRAPDYNGSMFLATPGVRRQLFDDFDPRQSPIDTRNARKLGSDQGWLSYRCPGEAVWTARDGLYSWNPQLRNRGWRLPPDARMVFFPGGENPWHTAAQQRAPWINEHYR